MPNVKECINWHGVAVFLYKINVQSLREIHPWLVDLEAEVLRAESCHNAAMALRHKGLILDVIWAHHGWGEMMFLKDVW